ncbi:MAG: TrbC/VirB2 family protein [Candidatus Dojkabacteria bacterium]|nr:TrbC/VirB2 family protein [Candidatus Dojkabacteria bacterium]
MKEKVIKTTKKFSAIFATFLFTTLLFSSTAFAATDPTSEISNIIERIVKIVTQVGSGILILFIVKDAFEMLQNKDNPAYRNILLRDIFMLIIAAIFLFKPDFILQAVKFIANV